MIFGISINRRNIMFFIAAALALVGFLIIWKGFPVAEGTKTFPELVFLSLFFGWFASTL